VPYTGRGTVSGGPRNPKNPFSRPQPHPSAPRFRQRRSRERYPQRNFTPRAGPRCRQSTPADHNTHSRPRTNLAPPHSSASDFTHQNPQASNSSSTSIPSTRCGRCNDPHLVNTHRELKNQGTSLLFGLGRLVHALEALEPDPAEMEWARDTSTVFYLPAPPQWFPTATATKDNGQRGEGGGFSFGNADGGSPAQAPPRGPPRASATGPCSLAVACANTMAGGAAPAPAPTTAGSVPEPAPGARTEERQGPGLRESAPYCLDSCFSEGLWDRTPREDDRGVSMG